MDDDAADPDFEATFALLRLYPPLQRARRKEQALSHLLSELSPMSDTTVVSSVIELQGRFPGLGKVWASAVHKKLRYAKHKSFHEQVANEVIQRQVKNRKISELADFCPDSATLNSRYGGSYSVQDTLVGRVMPHRLAKLKQDVSDF